MREPGIAVHPSIILRWVPEYSNLIYQIWKKKNKTIHLVWYLDETYIKVKGKYYYLYRAIDGDGHTLDIHLRRTCDCQTTYMFMKCLVKAFRKPSVLTTDKAPDLLCTFKKLQNDVLPDP